MNKRLIALFVVLILLFTAGCTKKQGDSTVDQPTPNAAGTPTSAPVDLLSSTTPVPNAMKPVTEDKEPTVTTVYKNILPDEKSKFEGLKSVSDSGWSIFGKGTLELAPGKGQEDSDALKCIMNYGTSGTEVWNSPCVNLADLITEAGSYVIAFDILLEGEYIEDINGAGFDITVRGDGEKDANSFIVLYEPTGLYRFPPSETIDGYPGEWMTVEFELVVEEDDIDGKKHSWKLCMQSINTAIKNVYIDNFCIYLATTASESQVLVDTAETYVASEMTFVAQKAVNNPVFNATLDVVFKNGDKEMTVPGFWDGGNIWRVRFALPTEGAWTYTTVFSDKSDKGVHGITGTVNVKKYSGDLEIYKHGFVKTDPDKKYFVYADGTPFFYLGDTHWNYLTEEYDVAGPNAADLNTTSHFKYIVNKRVSQGFTVYQSEPIGAGFDLANGITDADIKGLRSADKYYKYIADQGLVHANSEFFFSSTMNQTIMKMDNYLEYLDVLSRYWVARFGAYPVMWTLAQEIDDDYFYNETSNNTTMNAVNNPWKNVCEYLYKYDPYKNPISGHQESCTKLMDQTTASDSAFRNTQGHSWWATQWKPKLDQALDFTAPFDFWTNGQGKPSIVYEGRYENLWTNEYGARVQGWLAILNGMYGHGYGATDMWLYQSDYDMQGDTVRDGITITLEEKSVPWGEAIEFAAGYQMGYMKSFFENYQWWNLVPTFGSRLSFESETGTYSIATIEDDLYICYFYDEIDKEFTKKTGVLKGLDGEANYVYYWYNPRTTATGNKIAVPKGSTFDIGDRPSAEDWVLVVEKVK